MKKRFAFTVIILTLTVAGAFFLKPLIPNRSEKTIHIAVAGPMTGKSKENGAEMVRGIQICMDEFKKTGKLNDIRLQLVIFDDKNKSTAIRIASQIADDKKVLLVIGHFDSYNSLAAGSVYNKTGIPAITASASAEEITSDNDWYFRLIPDTSFISSFMLEYIKKELKTETVSIIHDKSEYAPSVIQKIEKESERLGIAVSNKWEYDGEDSNPEKQIYSIIGVALSAADPGTIIMAAEEIYGTDIIGYTRYPGADIDIIAPPAFSTPSFITQINSFQLEKKNPGYYTDGIYAVAPFLSYLADNPESDLFRKEYVRRFDKEPSWIAASYYDAMRMALEGIERGEVHFDDIREDRRKVRDAITRFDSPDVAVKGVTGDIWFDRHRNANGQSLYAGIWQNQVFIPAYAQYRHVEASLFYDKLYEYGSSKLIKISDQMMMKQRVIYTGIDVNEIKSIRVDKGIFSIDFNLWFRFQETFDPSRIIFLNPVNPISLGSPIFTETTDNVKTVVYRLNNEFRFDPVQVKKFPFDRHHLHIRLRHTDMPRMQLIFVPDISGLNLANTERNIPCNKNFPITDWDVNTVFYPQYTMNFSGSGGKSFPYSVHDIDIEIQRKHAMPLFLKTCLPLLFMAVLLYMAYVIPADQLGAKLLISLPMLAVSGVLHFMHGAHHVIRNALFAFYAAAAIAVLLSVGIFWLGRLGRPSLAALLTRIGKMIHPAIMMAAAVYISYSYVFG